MVGTMLARCILISHTIKYNHVLCSCFNVGEVHIVFENRKLLFIRQSIRLSFAGVRGILKKENLTASEFYNM